MRIGFTIHLGLSKIIYQAEVLGTLLFTHKLVFDKLIKAKIKSANFITITLNENTILLLFQNNF